MVMDFWPELAKTTLPTSPSPPEGAQKTAAQQTLELKRHIVQDNLKAIVIRCTEGDKRSDWLPIIERLANEALRYLPDIFTPPADTVAVPREALETWRDTFLALECPASAAQIDRLLQGGSNG